MKHTAFSAEEVRNLYQEHTDRFDQYTELLLWWNNKINLVSRDVPRETIQKHIEHSLLLSFFLDTHRLTLDTGTGGGLPGIPLAIVNPESKFVLNDIQLKKGAAIRQMVSELGLANVSVQIKSIDQVVLEEPVTVVSKHAFKLKELVPALQKVHWKEMILLKGLLDIDLELGYLSAGDAGVVNLHEFMKDDWYKGKGLLRVENLNG